MKISQLIVAIVIGLVLAAGCARAPTPQLALVVDGLERPLGVTTAGDGSNRMFVIEQGGTIRVIVAGSLVSEPFLDISANVSTGGERGLLGLAFSPDYASSGIFYAMYTDSSGDSVLSRFTVSSEPNLADPASEQVVLRQPQPFSNHNGGHVTFGPDGYLYVGLGDGGGSGDPNGNGQDLGTWYGTILRIDVAGTDTYQVPDDNPFVGQADARPEIWAYGLRNPWRFSFDRETGDLWIGDVGENSFEEIDLQPAGADGGINYGWSIMEGPECFQAATCDRSGLELPVISYGHDRGWGRSVTGGFVYRGDDLPQMTGTYLFGDFISGRVFQAVRADDGSWEATGLFETDMGIASFGEDEDGELYVVDIIGGALHRIVAE